MPGLPTTRPSLLMRLRNHRDSQAWAQFVDLYAPFVYGYLRKRGLQDADAADLTQLCWRQVAVHVGSMEYSSGNGSFRASLFTIVRNKLIDFFDRLHHRDRGTGQSSVQRLLENQSAPEVDEAAEWERAYQANLFAWAAEQIRPTIQESTWEAFHLTAVQGMSGKDAAGQLGMSVA